MALPQRGLEFIRDLALESLDVSDAYNHIEYQQGSQVLDGIGRAGQRVCKFVMSPGPEAQLVVLAQRPDRPIIGTIHDTRDHTPALNMESHPYTFRHSHKFWQGRLISAEEAVTVVAYLANLGAIDQPDTKVAKDS